MEEVFVTEESLNQILSILIVLVIVFLKKFYTGKCVHNKASY